MVIATGKSSPLASERLRDQGFELLCDVFQKLDAALGLPAHRGGTVDGCDDEGGELGGLVGIRAVCAY
ncbi:phosphoketolase [Kitasatospora sp. MAA4]|uniref:hypothetical protein n=1 Tax=Kitasatospora sp. MAA4 TaxID=3035093 RepID=UPI002474DE23|nr:hypothetical protein [Kitasatospora sp. MAA4]MDH6130974.1 phosphoketolase [Kitasatospora sp. MAA4]